MEYNKLVRDNIPDIIKNNGTQPFTHIADDNEYAKSLTHKLHEEVSEFLEEPTAEEVADILEVLMAICALKNIDLNSLEKVRQKKVKKRGAFKKRIILERTEEA